MNIKEYVLSLGPCYYCGDPDPVEVEHIIPRKQGGSDNLDNLVPSCWACNNEKRDRTPGEWIQARIDQGLCWPPPIRSINQIEVNVLVRRIINSVNKIKDIVGDDINDNITIEDKNRLSAVTNKISNFLGIPAEIRIEKTYAYILSKYPLWVSTVEITNYVLNNNAPASPIMNTMEEQGLVESRKIMTGKKGKPRIEYRCIQAR